MTATVPFFAYSTCLKFVAVFLQN